MGGCTAQLPRDVEVWKCIGLVPTNWQEPLENRYAFDRPTEALPACRDHLLGIYWIGPLAEIATDPPGSFARTYHEPKKVSGDGGKGPPVGILHIFYTPTDVYRSIVTSR
jgi:hypothetical protein